MTRIQRHVRAARLKDGQDRRQPIQAALDQYRHCDFRTGPLLHKAMGKAVRAEVRLPYVNCLFSQTAAIASGVCAAWVSKSSENERSRGRRR